MSCNDNMNEGYPGPGCYGKDKIPWLSRKTPNLELESVAPESIEVFLLIEPCVIFLVEFHMIKIEKKIVGGWGSKNWMWIVVRTSPDLSDNILSKWMLQHLNQIIVINHI